LILLGISLAGFYYSSQVSLEYRPFWWVYALALASSLIFLGGIVMAVDEWLKERNLRDQIEKRMSAETEEIRRAPDEEEKEEEEEEPAQSVGEDQTTPKSSLDINNLIKDDEN
jgi:uncharacterized membrane protein YcjF (UPF0283 family)